MNPQLTALASIAIVNAVGARADLRVWRAMQRAAQEAERRAAAQTRATKAVGTARKIGKTGKVGKGGDRKRKDR